MSTQSHANAASAEPAGLWFSGSSMPVCQGTTYVFSNVYIAVDETVTVTAATSITVDVDVDVNANVDMAVVVVVVVNVNVGVPMAAIILYLLHS